ncbi:glycosyltransferase family 39 protein [Carboxylicivirga sp. M1479]|uniref:ArnT family glycosyltransferase n=1 Tax=Carboxylicivirga sp. M1479 TaxID=2594476 RepID=UPI001177403C|nr:glycosyltransferase family 39 protein [Carboxylicivirga sp. M1479]TRX72423.1 hypothetical protein FNN09_00355 [Carboxylicivirga sp. M1479]
MKKEFILSVDKKANSNFVFFIFFVFSICFIHALSFDKKPARIHAWAQSDHYALSLGFIDNGFDFFHPQTYTLSVQFPSDQTLQDPKGITAVDFPILHYIVAILMQVLGTTKPWVFRAVSLLWSFFALFYLFKELSRIKDKWLAYLVVAFIMFQPIYSYYQNGFHVSAAALNTQIVGIVLLFKYIVEKKSKFFAWGIFFLTLAALMRFTQIITLIAVFCAVFIDVLKRGMHKKQLLFVVLGVAIVLSYFVYNKILSSRYGSVFLGSPLPADSINDLLLHLFQIGKSYLRGFLPFFHLFALIVFVFLKKEKQLQKQTTIVISWLLFSLLGTSMFSLLMSWSLSAHDYYALDTWMPPLTIGLLYLVYTIDLKAYSYRSVMLFSAMFVVGSFAIALENQVRKYSDKVEMKGADLTIDYFDKSSGFLDEIISEESKVLLINSAGWNTPMVSWKRPVHRAVWKLEEQLPIELSKDYDFIVTLDLFFQTEVINHYPSFLSEFEIVDRNTMVSIWRKRKTD